MMMTSIVRLLILAGLGIIIGSNFGFELGVAAVGFTWLVMPVIET